MEEPLLKERSDRFVLFPIEDEDVSVLPEMVFILYTLVHKTDTQPHSSTPKPDTTNAQRYGKCINKRKLASGLLKK